MSDCPDDAAMEKQAMNRYWENRELQRRLDDALRTIERLRTALKNRPRDRRKELSAYRRGEYRRGHAPHVYVISDGRGRLKVGKTVNVSARLRTMRTTVPELEIVRTVSGYTAAEESLHSALGAFHLVGEWYRVCDESRAIVASWQPPVEIAA